MTDDYEAPKAIRLDDANLAYGACEHNGSTPTLKVGYRVNEFEGICVTGKSAEGGCHAGAGAV